MTVREISLAIKHTYRNYEGERFFTEKALLSALFEKCGLGKNAPLCCPERELSEEICRRLSDDAAALLEGYPLQYYLGTEFFCGEEFLVCPNVLIPRPETELLVEKAVGLAEKGSTVWDLCCGSGCIGIALLKKRPDLKCVSVDLSPDAVALTERNRARFHLEDRLRVVRGDVFSPLLEEFYEKERPSLILSNPPYLTSEEMEKIPRNVRNEPSLALFGGEGGLRFYERLVAFAAAREIPLICEIGAEQKKGLEGVLSLNGVRGDFYRDFSGFWRVVHCTGKRS